MKLFLAAAALIASASFSSAATVSVDLSGATSGTVIVAPGASFAGTFDGQTIDANTGITGTPSGPLTLVGSNQLVVAPWNPLGGGTSNSILPQPNNQGPLSILLDSLASSITFTAGSANGGAFDVAFFALNGSLVETISQSLANGYAIFSFAPSSSFAGLTIFNNTDPAGLRFQDFSYETATAAIPLPAGGLLLISGLGALVAVRRRKALAS